MRNREIKAARELRKGKTSLIPRVKEKDLQKAITDILQLDGWRVFHFERIWNERAKKTMGEIGMPDLCCIRYIPECDLIDRFAQAYVLWIEVKAKGGKLSTDQRIWHDAERAYGAVTWIAGQDFPATIEGFIEHYAASGLYRRKDLA